jgi:sporulation protein YlmC with PRC-barrel domain
MTLARTAAILAAATFAVAPALAQNAAGPGNGTGAAPGTPPAVGTSTPTTGGTPPAGMVGAANTQSPNPVLTDSGQIRVSKVIGAAVYNDKDQKLGSLEDVLLGADEKATQAVISVGGVLGVGARLVAVPFSQLQFPDKVGSSTSRVMMPGITGDSLKGMPAFHYASG